MTSLFVIRKLTIINVANIHKIPISIVEANFDMSRIHAIKVRMKTRTSPGVHGPTYMAKSVHNKPLIVSVMNAQNEIVNENWVAAIMKSRITFALLPRTLSVINEYDFNPRCIPT